MSEIYVVTGTRTPLTLADRERIIQTFSHDGLQYYGAGSWLYHGACKTGVDKFVDAFGREWGYAVKPFPADWNAKGKAGGPIRNREMFKGGATSCYAFPRKGQRNRGTRDCILAALNAEVDTTVTWLAALS